VQLPFDRAKRIVPVGLKVYCNVVKYNRKRRGVGYIRVNVILICRGHTISYVTAVTDPGAITTICKKRNKAIIPNEEPARD
jgi:hypothetical protein